MQNHIQNNPENYLSSLFGKNGQQVLVDLLEHLLARLLQGSRRAKIYLHTLRVGGLKGSTMVRRNFLR
jgi:hypothetical protein